MCLCATWNISGHLIFHVKCNGCFDAKNTLKRIRHIGS